MTLVNDQGKTLDQLCDRGPFGKRCTKADYQSWRRVAVSLRRTLMFGEYEGAESVGQIARWLRAWVTSEDCGAVEFSAATIEASNDPDPDSDCLRFPRDLSIWSAQYSPGGANYLEQTERLAAYIREGEALMRKASGEGARFKKDTEIQRAEERSPTTPTWGWLKWAGAAAGAVAVIVTGVWAYATVRGADDK